MYDILARKGSRQAANFIADLIALDAFRGYSSNAASSGPFICLIETSMAAKRQPAWDRLDIKILAGLQRSGRSTIQALAQEVGLSPRACLERVRRLESAGVIAGYRAVIELGRLSRPISVFAEIILEKQAHQARFERRLATIDEVVECWEVSGTVDYIARFVCPDVAAYEALTSRLIDDAALGVARIVSHIALRPVRRFAGYPESLLFQKPA
jgi:Lrp/AsnC family transcriptional regulator, regulator of ectoine-degradation genes